MTAFAVSRARGADPRRRPCRYRQVAAQRSESRLTSHQPNRQTPTRITMIPTTAPTKKNAASTARNYTVSETISSIPIRSSFKLPARLFSTSSRERGTSTRTALSFFGSFWTTPRLECTAWPFRSWASSARQTPSEQRNQARAIFTVATCSAATSTSTTVQSPEQRPE